MNRSARGLISSFPLLEVVGLLMIIGSVVVLLLQMGQYSTERQDFPPGMTLGGVPVSGFSRIQAQAQLEQVYGSPVTIYYEDEEVRLNPAEIGFVVDSESMLSRADELRTEGTFWAGFWDYLWRRPARSFDVEFEANYSPELLAAWVSDLATRYDKPPTQTTPVLETLSYTPGEPGFTLEQESAVALIDEALRRPTNRSAILQVAQKPPPSPGLATLEAMLIQYLTAEQFIGVASIYVIDLQTGEELDLNLDLRSGNPSHVNCDIAYAGTSQIKVPILVAYFKHLDWIPTPESDDYKIIYDTMTRSGNISANFMMQNIGVDNLDLGVQSVTNMAQYLGMENTFIVAPYDDEEPPEYFSTPAREAARDGSCINSRPDAYMQTTTADMARLFDLVYQCAEFGGGGLVAAYPGDFTQEECQMMLEVMSGNDEGVLIMAGVPPDVEVAHKHGWISDTHGDSGIVLSPGGDYVLSVFLWADVEWLYYEYSFPLIAGVSEATFNYFNPDLIYEPRLGLTGY